MAGPYDITLEGTHHRASCQVPWDGVTRFPAGSAASAVSFDVETPLIDDDLPGDVPELALATACYGGVAVLIWPEQLADWLALHAGCHLVGHNVVFDWWVVHEHLTHEAPGRVEAWKAVPREGRLHDTMVLDQLVRLAGHPYPFVSGREAVARRNLGEAARQHLKAALDKDDPYRRRYGELLADRGLLDREPGFWRYALKDAVATHLLWLRLHAAATQAAARYNRRCPRGRRVPADAAARYGVLTESLQVQGALALFAATRRGLRLDQQEAARIAARLAAELDAEVAAMRQHFPSVFRYAGGRKRDLPGQLFLPGVPVDVKRTEQTGVPSVVQDELRKALVACATDLGEDVVYTDAEDDDEGDDAGDDVDDGSGLSEANILSGARTVSLSAKAWAHLAPRHPFVAAWCRMQQLTKQLGMERAFSGRPTVHPRYNPILVTGRTSASAPNIQQAIRDDWFRRQFVARPGHVLYCVDYSYIELRTFAAVCLAWLGFSRMAEVIRDGIDPHAYTAAMLQDLSIDDFCRLKQADEPRYKRDRQNAKCLNFGLIGGLGAKRLVEYAASQYGVRMTERDAKRFRDKVINDVYPEMKLYLTEPLTALNHNLDAGDRDLSGLLFAGRDKASSLRALKATLAGGNFKGTPLHAALLSLAGRMPPALARLVRAGRGHPDVERWLFGECVATPTGRLCGGRVYTAARNLPFQALAADGAKLALWRLLDEGLPVVAFVHDEVLVELPADRAGEMAARVDACLVEGMREAIGDRVPVAVEGRLAPHWAKG